MSNCKPNDGFFEQKWYLKGLIDNYKNEKISVLAGTINYVFNKISWLINGWVNIKSNSVIGGRPPLNYLGSIKVYFLLVCRGLSLRDLTRVATPGSEYMYLLGEDNIIPKKTSNGKITNFMDQHINEIFDAVNQVIEAEIGVNKETLYCDGTIFEAHNSRNKVITSVNVKKGIERWTNKLNEPNLTEEEYQIAEEKLAKWQERAATLSNLDRNSYGLTDFDSILVQDKNKAYIAGYNVQFVEEAKHGLVVYTHVSNKTPDVNAFREMIGGFLMKFEPNKLVVDAGYDAPDILEMMSENNITLVAKTRKGNHSETAINELSFELNEAEDALICPNNKELFIAKKRKDNRNNNVTRFVCKECKGCPFAAKCKPIKGVKHIVINIAHYKRLKAIKGFVLTDEGKAIYEHRGNICESPHGFMKYYLKGKKLKRNGLKANNTTIKILALGYNLTRFYNIKTNM